MSAVSRYSQMVSLGACRGEISVANEEIAGPINSSDAWIRQRTGIETRARARPQTTPVQMAVTAARQALERADFSASRLDLIIVSTVTNFKHTPSVAAELGYELGVGNAAVFDINAACAGYTHAIALADQLIRGGMARSALVVGTEKLSEIIDPTERSISFLLADGAGAALVYCSSTPGILKTVWGSDTAHAPTVGLNGYTTDLKHGLGPWPTLRQQGQSVFRWAVWEMAKVAKEILRVNGLEPNQIGAFVPHQANIRIINELAHQIGFESGTAVAQDIRTTGNTSSASIPLAMDQLLEKHPELSGRLALQIGFGAGLVYAGQVVVMP